ncbi:dynamin family protein [Streptomyces luteogriseus]|uniref:GTPase SAR1 family protein n=1 Tax=Streptomyces luteogriseus TaxID=68233 RepID=A0A7W7GFA1_9ACTN|nr:dynamin family protein [Streptomyces luteogriseus]MBB4710163.1 GTPase SAR1 family protein [Streptomyces luteogriseus]
MTEQLVVNGTGAGWTSVVAGNLRWIEELLDSLGLPAERSDELRARLTAVRARAADPQLRVAVFGEASSGKSTLLNAFLRRRLLPSSALVTTRTTTSLECLGGAEGLTVRTIDDTVLEWPSAPFARWAGLKSGPGTMERALERVLTTELAEDVSGLWVHSPARLLGGGLTVIDTPGFSVTERGHRELAEAAARQADLALVVVPTVAAMSLTLADFLTGPLRDHHDRCAFVLTKIDLLDEEERAEAVEVAERRLRDLGCADPLLLPCAPGKALGEVTGGGRERDGAGHLAVFERVEARIARLAADSRQSAIAATVLGLLSELLSAVEETAEARRTALARGERELAALTLPDLTAVLDSWSARTLDRTRAEMNAATIGMSGTSRTKLDSKVGDAVAGEKINDLAAAAQEVSRLVRRHLRRHAERVVQKAARRAGELLTTAADELARDFTAQYSALAGLAGESRTAPPVPSVAWPELPAPDMSGIDQALTAIGARLTSGDNWRTGGGAMAGALAGSLVAPVIGTVIGGALGALIGRRGADATREQFLRQARPVITAAHEEIAALAAACLPRVQEELAESVAALRRRYDDEWRDEITRLTEAHDRRRAELAVGIARVEKTAAAARRRRDEVAALRRATGRTVPEPEES